MSSRSVIPISAHPQIGKIDESTYHRLYQESVVDPDRFWGERTAGAYAGCHAVFDVSAGDRRRRKRGIIGRSHVSLRRIASLG